MKYVLLFYLEALYKKILAEKLVVRLHNFE